MAETRNCEQCGTAFVPRREHARFCSARCRVAWNREKTTYPPAEVNALQWSITAMSDTTQRLARIRAANQPRAFAVVSEAVWWVTIVDATMVRHHPDTYDAVLAARPTAERRLIEGTLAGLRFVRNRMGSQVDHVDFIRPHPRGPGDDRLTAWTWKSLPTPSMASLPPSGRAWELRRYRAYQAHLAGATIGDTFGRVAEFLNLAAAAALGPADVSERAPDRPLAGQRHPSPPG
ncbi:MAG TPA: hypothetical protein VIX86_25290 [Streptosporangiaceae bacterium]